MLLGHSILSNAQDSAIDNKLKTLVKIDIGLKGIGFTVEPGLADKMTIDLSAGVGGGYDVSEDQVAYQWNILQPAFYFSATLKFFYNREKRIAQSKKAKFNSGNYEDFY